MNRPFVLLLFPLTFGILFNHFFQISLFTVLFTLILVLVYIFYNIIKGHLNQSIFILLIFILGILVSIEKDKSLMEEYIDTSPNIVACVDQVILQSDNNSKYVIQVKEVDDRPVDYEKAILTVIGELPLNVGDYISFRGQVRLPNENTNPKLFNYRLSLKADNVKVTITTREHAISKLYKDRKLKYFLKDKFVKYVENIFSSTLNEENSSLITSIILGKSSYMEEESLDFYREIGLAHVLAVSGLHIGVISSFLIFLLSRLGIKRRTNVIITLSIIWLYGYMIDYPASILRANIMFTIILYSQLIHRPFDSINNLALAAFILLVINPYYLFDVGFQLSFLATFSLLSFTPKIAHLFYPYDNRLTNSLASILAVHIGLFPIQAYYFNSFNPLSLLANLVVVPLLSLSLIIGMMVLSLYFWMGRFSLFFAYLLNLLLSLQFKLLRLLDSLPISLVKLKSPEMFSIILFYISLFIIFKMIKIDKIDKRIIRVIVVYLIILLVWDFFLIIGDESMEIHFIDVGQGDAILIRTKYHNYMMDTGGSLFGNFDIGKNITLPYLEKLGIRRLDAVFISHFHEDHCQALPTLMDQLRIDNIVSGYAPEKGEVAEAIRESKIPFTIVNRGDRVYLDKNIVLEVLWPKEDVAYLSENNKSLVALLRYRDFNILFTGDLEKEGEGILAKEMEEVDIIKIPHHGSKTSSTEGFLEKTRPQYGVISVGRNNFYNHPSPEVVERYEKFQTKLYRTDENGLIKVKLDKDIYSFDTFIVGAGREKIDLLTLIYDNLYDFSYYLGCFVLLYIMVRTGFYEGNGLNEI